MTNPPVPATPLDVEACVRLANREAAGCEYAAQHNREQAKYEAADDPEYAARARRLADESTAEAAVWRALASALPGMGKDSAEVFNLRWRLTLAKSSLECYGRHHPWCASQDAVDEECDCGLQNLLNEPSAARAAQPEETSADAE